MKNLFLPLLLILPTSCLRPVFPEDSLPVYEERPVYGTITAPYSEVWDACLQVISERCAIANVDKDAGLILTEWVEGTSDYIFATFAGTKIPEKIRYQIRLEVKNRGNKVEVRIVNHEQVEKDILSANLEFTGAVYEWIDVPTSTKKEREILQEIIDIIEKRADSRSSEMD